MIITVPVRPLWIPAQQPAWAIMRQQRQESLHRICCCDDCVVGDRRRLIISGVVLCTDCEQSPTDFRYYVPLSFAVNGTHTITCTGITGSGLGIYEGTITNGVTWRKRLGDCPTAETFDSEGSDDITINVAVDCTCDPRAIAEIDVGGTIGSTPWNDVFSFVSGGGKGGCVAPYAGDSINNDLTTCGAGPLYNLGHDGTAVVTT